MNFSDARARRFAAALMISTSMVLAADVMSGVAVARTVSEAEAARYFFDAGYTYCDAKLVAVLWSIDIGRAKAEIGMKIINGIAENIEPLLAEARNVSSCDFWDTGLTYDDAVYLGSVWGVSVDYAKAKVANYYTYGRSDIVAGALS